MAQFWSSILIPRYATGRCLWIILQLSWDKTQGVTSVYSGASTKPQLWSATPCSKAAKRGLLSQWLTRNGLWSNWGQIHARAAVLANCLEGCLLVVLQELRLLIPGHSWDHCGWINKNAANLGNHEVWPVPFSYPGRFLGVLTHLSHLVPIKPRELSTGNSGSSKDAASEIPSHAVTCQRNSKHFQALWIGDSYDYCNRCSMISMPKECLCRCIHIQIYIYTNIYILYKYIYICIQISISISLYIYMYVCVCMCMYVYVCVCMCIYI